MTGALSGHERGTSCHLWIRISITYTCWPYCMYTIYTAVEFQYTTPLLIWAVVFATAE